MIVTSWIKNSDFNPVFKVLMKRSIKSDKKKWLNNIASQAEEAARSQHTKTLYLLTKTLSNGSQSRQSTSVMDKHGNLLANKKDIQDRWTEHFKEVLNREPPQNPITIVDDEEKRSISRKQ